MGADAATPAQPALSPLGPGMPVLVAGYGYLGNGPRPEAWGADGVVHSAGAIGEWIRA